MSEINPSFVGGETRIISTEITLTKNLVLPENVTLIFQGGRFVSETDVEIVGNNTALVAPIVCIFGKNIRATGSWTIDVAYPQWFENTYFYTPKGGTDIYPDMAAPINKAITMKWSGRVELLPGTYHITEPIYIPVGIHLTGNSAQADGKTGIRLCSRIIPGTKDGSGETSYMYPHMIYINSNGVDTFIEEFPQPWIALSNITILSYPNVLMPPDRCVYVAGGVTIDMVHWVNFAQAIEFRNMYSDAKVIRNCNHDFYDDEGLLNDRILSCENGDRYVFNLQGLGDELVFENNHMGDGRPMLYIDHCGGGRISNNILNGDVTIKNSKAIELSYNHMENSPQIHIQASVVNMCGNYIEKGPRSSILIHDEYSEGVIPESTSQCVVSMCDDQFVYYEVDRSENETLQDKEDRIKSISEEDIIIDETAILKISNVYRYQMVVGFGSVQPYGIKIGTLRPRSNFEFNNYSYFASVNSTIERNCHLQASASFRNLNEPKIYWAQQVGWVPWFAESGTYRYFYRIVWDRQRCIYKTVSSKTIFEIATMDMEKYGKGLLFVFGRESADAQDFEKEQFNFMVELCRYKLDESGAPPTKRERVLIPLCGVKTLYDNGYAVGGYVWKEEWYRPTNPNCPNYEMYSYNSAQVQCGADKPELNTGSEWKAGDVIYNVGDDNSWILKVIKK